VKSDLDALVNIIKANIGSGLLGMPYAFKNGGVYLGLITLLVIAAITFHTTIILTVCKNTLNGRRRKNGESEDIHTYGDVGKASLGWLGAALIDIFLVFTQTGFSCAYLIYIGENMHDMIPQLANWHAVAVAIVILIPVCMLRNLKYLAPTSILSEVCIIVGLLIVVYYNIHALATTPFPGTRNIKYFNWSEFPLFFGVCCY
jgi:proton-coupled amino acid transporter